MNPSRARFRRVRSGVRVLVAAVGLVTLAARAEEPAGPSVFRTFADEDGFGNAVAEVLLQDRAGFLWIGTADGLYRYDGRTFTSYGVADGLPAARVTALHETKDGRLYAGTRAGLARRDGLGFRALGAKAGLPETTIAAISSDAAGTLYVATPKGLFTSISELFHVDARKDGPERPITALAAEPSGVLWFARDGKLLRREKGNTSEWGSAHGLPPLDRIDELGVSGGRLWVRTVSRLLSAPLAGGAFAAEDDGLPPAAAWGRVAFDAQGAPLVPTARGLAERRGRAWRLRTRRDGLPGDVVLAALEDREGSLWVSVAGVGLANRPGRGDFSAFTRREGLAGDTVLAIARETGGKGALFVGTDAGLTRLGTDGSARTLTERDGLGGGAVFALAAAEDGGVWAGSVPGGVTRVSADGRARRYPPHELQVLALHARKGGEVWAGAADGVWRLAPGGSAFERVAVPGGDEPDTIYGFVEDRSGALFAFGRFGFSRLTPAPRRFRRRNGLKGDFVVSCAPVDSGFILAYRDAPGIEHAALDGEKLQLSPFAAPGSEGRVPDRAVFVARDARGALWIGSSGVEVFGSGAPVHFGRTDGLLADEVNVNAFFADPDGTVWIGTKRGLARRAAVPLPRPRPAPPVAFTLASAGARRLPTDRPAVLTAKERSLRVAWAGLGFSEARRLRYRYRLEGVDDADTESAVAELTLKGLPPGRYGLSVAAVAPSGEVGKPSRFAFRVSPAWYQTLLARVLFAAVVVGAAWAFVRRHTRALTGEIARLTHTLELRDAEVRARTRELEEASLTDTLTGLKNRRFFFAVIPSEVERTVRANAPLATPAERRSGDLIFYFVELDRLKEINERWGNGAGDAVLLEVVRRLKSVVRSSDYLVRWGGNVFLVATRTTVREQAHVLAERVLGVIAEEPFAVDGSGVSRTCSIGWAPFPWAREAPEVLPYEDALRFADHALDAAKAAGRNRAFGAVPSRGKRAAGARTIEGLENVPLAVVETDGPPMLDSRA